VEKRRAREKKRQMEVLNAADRSKHAWFEMVGVVLSEISQQEQFMDLNMVDLEWR